MPIQRHMFLTPVYMAGPCIVATQSLSLLYIQSLSHHCLAIGNCRRWNESFHQASIMGPSNYHVVSVFLNCTKFLTCPLLRCRQVFGLTQLFSLRRSQACLQLWTPFYRTDQNSATVTLELIPLACLGLFATIRYPYTHESQLLAISSFLLSNYFNQLLPFP